MHVVYTFPSTPIAPHEILRTSLVLNLPTVDAAYGVDQLGVYVRNLVGQPNVYSPWASLLRLPASTTKYRLQGLQPGRAYQLRIRGMSEGGPLQYSRTIPFSTPSLGKNYLCSARLSDRTCMSYCINDCTRHMGPLEKKVSEQAEAFCVAIQCHCHNNFSLKHELDVLGEGNCGRKCSSYPTPHAFPL